MGKISEAKHRLELAVVLAGFLFEDEASLANARALLSNVLGSLWAIGLALRFRSLNATPLMQVPFFVLLFLAPVYVPQFIGWVSVGFTVDDALAAALRKLTGLEVSFVTLADRASRTVPASSKSRFPGLISR